MNTSKENKNDPLKNETKKTKIPKKKCKQCNCKLKLIVFTCKCGHIFCQKHLGAHSHNCTYDYKNEKKEKIEKENPKLGQKFETI